MIFDLNNYIDPIKTHLYICRPDRTIVGELNEAFSIQRNTKLGNIFDLSFKMPYFLDLRMKLRENPNIQFIKNRFLIKFVQGNVTEWYIIKNPQDTMDDSTDYKIVTAYLLPIQLADKNIRNYTATSINATSALTVALAETNWTIGTVDASFDILFRTFNVTNSNVLDFIFQIATTFNALVDFNTINRKVSLIIFNNYGTNKGLEVSYGNLLKSANQVENTDEFYTRLKVFGANGISIQGQNSVGSNYIEDYSWFLQGYQEDGSGNVIGHSTEGMSDSLCKALITYRNKVIASNTTFQTYLAQLTGYQTTLTTQQNTLQTYKNELALIEDQISSANYTGASTTTLVTQKNAKNAQIASQNTAIATNQSNINSVNANITTLQNTLSIPSNFTNAQIVEWNDYIVIGTFENSNVSDSKQLYDLAVAEFEKLKQPKIVVNISIVNFLECVEEQARWGMLNLGDTLTIKNAKIGINVQAKIIEMNFDYESGDVNLVISNVKELLSDETRFLRDMYRANTTSSVVSNNEDLWNGAVTDASSAQSILNAKWDATAREIQASVDNTVSISRKGVIVSDVNDPNKILILQKGLLAISGNQGNTWSTAIDATGVYAPRLVGQILIGTNLYLSNTGGNVSITSSGMTVSSMDMSVVKSDTTSRVLISGSNGLRIQKNTGTVGSPVWGDVFNADSTGNLSITGNINATSGNFSGNITATGTISGGTISGANFNNGAIVGSSINIGSGAFTVSTSGAVVASNVTITGGSISWSSLNTNPAVTTAQSTANIAQNTANTAQSIASQIVAGTYTGGTFIDGKNVISANIMGGTITGGTIIGGTIKSNTDINVTRDITLGSNLYLTNATNTTRQSIVAPGGSSIDFQGSLMRLSAVSQVEFTVSRITQNGNDIATQSWVNSSAQIKFI